MFEHFRTNRQTDGHAVLAIWALEVTADPWDRHACGTFLTFQSFEWTLTVGRGTTCVLCAGRRPRSIARPPNPVIE